MKWLYKKYKRKKFELVDCVNEYILKSRRRNNLLLNIQTNKILSENGFYYGDKYWNPYVESVKDIISGTKSYKDSYLRKLYHKYQPQNAAEYYFLKSDRLKSFNWPAFLPPWEYMTSNEYAKWLIDCNKNENSTLSYKSKNIKGVSLCGPVSEMKGEIEFKRYFNLLNSINKKGYNTNLNSAISLTAIEWENETYFFVRHGRHRIAVLSALGYQNIPVILQPSGFITKRIIIENTKKNQISWHENDVFQYFENINNKKFSRSSIIGL